jgi:hypothetical protein
MRQLASFLLLSFTLTASAAEIWRWKDAEGTWHFSDSPVAGAEKLNVNPPGKSGGSKPASSPSYSGGPLVLPQEIVPYARCSIVQPVNDASFQWTESIAATVSVEPTLQGSHQVQAVLNGSPVADWPKDSVSHTFTGLFRGSYTLSVKIADQKGNVLCTARAINFHVRQPSVLSPARKPAGK